MRALLTLMMLAAVAAGVFALGRMRRESDDKPFLHVAEEMPLTVRVATPQRRGIVKIVQAPGDVEAVDEVDVSSEIVAKIEALPVEEGDEVKVGDLLCRLNDDNLRAAVESGNARVGALEAMIQQAEADLEQATRDYDRQLELTAVNATSDKERLDYLVVKKRAQATRDVRKQELAEAEAVLRRGKEDLLRTVINSPLNGVISRLNAEQGEVVITGTMNNPGTVIMTISDLSRMEVRVRVDEVDVPLVKPGQRARVYLQSDQQVPVSAKVVRVASKGTRMQGRDVVYFETLLEVLDQDARIKPGMTANVEIEVDQRDDAITVLVEAIVHRMRKDLDAEIVKRYDAKQEHLDLSERAKQAQYIKVVYVMEDGVARVRLVEPGIADTRRVELCEGVRLGDQVIVGPYRSLDQLEDGKKVALASDDKSAPVEDSPSPEDGEEKLADDDQDASESASEVSTEASS